MDQSEQAVVELLTPIVNIASGISDAYALIRVLNDEVIEEDQAVAMSITEVRDGTVGIPSIMMLLIKDDECKSNISI